jgi:uncharacterized membrane protein YtjA (UPF0391 family)
VSGLPSPARRVGSGARRRPRQEEVEMLSWALMFLVIAIIAALFGFGGIATASAGIAKILFFVFIVGFLIALIAGLMGGRRRSV